MGSKMIQYEGTYTELKKHSEPGDDIIFELTLPELVIKAGEIKDMVIKLY